MPIIDCSIGEIIDRLTIQLIKAKELDYADFRQKYLENERRALLTASHLSSVSQSHIDELLSVNRSLWDVLDEQRKLDAAGDFGPRFIHLSREVYRLNDRRCAIKNQINAAAGSEIREVKIY